MPVSFIEDRKLFKLDAAGTTYVMAVAPGNYLLGLYWGAPVPDANFDGYYDIFIGPATSRNYSNLYLWDTKKQWFYHAVSPDNLNGHFILNPARKQWVSAGSSSYCSMYYTIFRFAITYWDLKTPGREEEPVANNTPANPPALNRAQQYIQALGGKENIKTWGTCATRIRLEVADPQQVDEKTLQRLGARGVLKTAGGQVQVIIGPDVDLLADELKPYLN